MAVAEGYNRGPVFGGQGGCAIKSRRLSAHIVTHKYLNLTDTCAMAGTGGTGSPESPDDINNRLAEIAAELAKEARFKEPSAAERAKARVTAARPSGKSARSGPLRRLRARRKMAELLKPVDGSAIPAPPPKPPTARQVRRARRAARPAADRPFADRGYADASDYPSVARSVIAVLIIVALLVGAVIGLRYVFRHYGSTGAAADSRPAVATALFDHTGLSDHTGVRGLTVNLIK
jgi:hypothetical protein